MTSPVPSRQTEKARQTDLKVALSAAAAIRRDGVDQMALTRVAADAGYSSGVIYARCDDRSELLVLSWEKCIWPYLSGLFQHIIDAAKTQSPEAMNAVEREWTIGVADTTTPDLGSIAELLVASRRDEVIQEVVQNDITTLFEKNGIGPGTDSAERQAVIVAISTIIGAALINSVAAGVTELIVDPLPLSRRVLLTPRAKKRTGAPSPRYTEVHPYEAPVTHDQVRDALVAATEFVIAKSGVHRATVSRIARRAGVSVGAIYGLYDNKEALVLDCLGVLFPPQSERDAQNWSQVVEADDKLEAIAGIVSASMSPSYSQWRRFRVEALVAARHSESIAVRLFQLTVDARKTLNESMTETSFRDRAIDPTLPGRASVIGLAIMEHLDPTITSLDWSWVSVA